MNYKQMFITNIFLGKLEIYNIKKEIYISFSYKEKYVFPEELKKELLQHRTYDETDFSIYTMKYDFIKKLFKIVFSNNRQICDQEIEP